MKHHLFHQKKFQAENIQKHVLLEIVSALVISCSHIKNGKHRLIVSMTVKRTDEISEHPQ